MTFYELLYSVTFDEIIPFLEKKNGGPVSLALYKTHYDMLRLLTPRIGEGDSKTASITNAKLDYDGEEPHLFYTFCVIEENCVSFEKHQILIVSKTQILNNLISAERSGAQCEVERHCGDMFSKSAKT